MLNLNIKEGGGGGPCKVPQELPLGTMLQAEELLPRKPDSEDPGRGAAVLAPDR